MGGATIIKEQLHHKEAFEYYYGLGYERNYDKVASKFNVSKSTIHNWGKSFNWVERIELRDIENSKELERKTNETVVSEKANYRKLIKAMIGQAAQKVRDGTLICNTPKDVEMLIKLDLELMGEGSEGQDTVITVKLVD